MIRVKKSILIIAIITFLYNCSNSYIYESEIEIRGGKWKSDYAAIFKPEIIDTSQLFNINLSITNSNDYRYNNIWLFIKSISPEGFSKIDTVEAFIAEDDGKWIGKKNKDFYTSKIRFKKNVRFPKKGTYIFEIVHGMRELELKGIFKTGFAMQKIE